MGDLLDAVVSYCEEASLPYHAVGDRAVLDLRFHGRNADFECVAVVDEEDERFIFVTRCPVRAPQERRAAVAELLTRINYKLAVGNFEMDFEDGDIRFRTSVDVEGHGLSSDLVRNLIVPNVGMADRFFPALARVLYAETAPADALEVFQGLPEALN